MKNFITDIQQIYRQEKFMLILIILNFLSSTALFIVSLTKLNPERAFVKVGYGDIGGYQNGSWSDMLIFPILAIILGVFHNFIALRIYEKRGAGMTKLFLLTTTALVFGSFIVLLRLTGEN